MVQLGSKGGKPEEKMEKFDDVVVNIPDIPEKKADDIDMESEAENMGDFDTFFEQYLADMTLPENSLLSALERTQILSRASRTVSARGWGLAWRYGCGPSLPWHCLTTMGHLSLLSGFGLFLMRGEVARDQVILAGFTGIVGVLAWRSACKRNVGLGAGVGVLCILQTLMAIHVLIVKLETGAFRLTCEPWASAELALLFGTMGLGAVGFYLVFTGLGALLEETSRRQTEEFEAEVVKKEGQRLLTDAEIQKRQKSGDVFIDLLIQRNLAGSGLH